MIRPFRHGAVGLAYGSRTTFLLMQKVELRCSQVQPQRVSPRWRTRSVLDCEDVRSSRRSAIYLHNQVNNNSSNSNSNYNSSGSSRGRPISTRLGCASRAIGVAGSAGPADSVCGAGRVPGWCRQERSRPARSAPGLGSKLGSPGLRWRTLDVSARAFCFGHGGGRFRCGLGARRARLASLVAGLAVRKNFSS